MDRLWEGQLRGRDERVQVRMINGEGWQEIYAAMHSEQNGWQDPDKVEDRTPTESTYDIWVARFHDGSELLIEYWRSLDHLTVAYRSMSSCSWGPPAGLIEMVQS